MIEIDENMPTEVAPLAWLLGQWQGWGTMVTADDEEDMPIIEQIDADVVGTQVRVKTSIYAGTLTAGELDPTADAHTGLRTIEAGDLLREETIYLTVMSGSGAVLPAGEYEPREFHGAGSTNTGLGILWAGVVLGPRIQMVSDAIAREVQSIPVERFGRMYGLVGGELMWTQEQTLEGQETAIDLSGRLMRITSRTTGESFQASQNN